MRLQFDGYFQKYTNGLAEVELTSSTVGGAVALAFERFPQLYVHLVDNDGAVARASLFRLGDEPIWELESIRREVREESVLTLTLEIPQGESNVIKWVDPGLARVHGVAFEGASLSSLQAGAWMDTAGQRWLGEDVAGIGVGVGLIIVGVVFFAFSGGTSASLIAMGVGLIISTTMKMMAGPGAPELGNMSLNNSPTYTFSGIRNTTASGTPINIIYGAHRVGGHVLNMYTTYATDKDSTAEFLMAQLGLCEGEIESITEVEVNRSPLSYYREIETWTDHTGRVTQDALPGFDRTESTTSLGRLITSPSGELAVPTATYGAATPLYGYVDTDSNTIVEGRYVVELTDWYRVEEGGGG